MKPAFALDFRNDAIALLHRVSGGWHQVGRVTFDEPDLPEALSYLRATALGLDPRGLATKLILPDEQILYTTVDAPGPDDASRATQIRAALEGRTPYPVEDLVFDWEVQGGQVHVAVIARETLAEAEGFAAEHRFNPVSFAAAPDSGFAKEPWFGLSALAPSLLAAKEIVERDTDPLVIVERSSTLAEPKEPQVELPEESSAPEPEVEVEAEPEIPFEPVIEEPAFVEEPAVVEEPPVAEVDAPDEVEDSAEFDDEPLEPQGLSVEDLPASSQMEPAALERRDAPLFGVADDELSPSAAFRVTADAPAKLDLPADLAAALRDIELQDEAPMAVDVEDDATAAPQWSDSEPKPPAKADVTDLTIQDEVPPAPGYSPSMGFASRRASVDEARLSKVPPPSVRPAVSRPTSAKPLPPAAPKAERPMVSRPTAAKPVVAKEGKGLRGFGAFVTAPGLPGSRKKKNQPTAPVTATPVSTGAAAPNAITASDLASEATKSLGRGIGTRPAQRGKPRYLGLALTVILLLALAVIAAWSTSLAFRSDDSATTDLAANEASPDAEDEMLADGIDPEAEAALASDPAPVAEDVAQETAVPVAEAAPEALAEGQDAAPEPSANPGATSGDEIFLAAKDQAPIAPEPLDLPEVSAQGDPLPTAQAPPPPFGTVYQFDANGQIVPTPEGIVTPEGVLLIAGKPLLVPKPRPGDLVPAAAPSVTDPATAPVDSALDPAAADAGAPFPSDPALAKFRPKTRPEGLAPPAATADDAALTPSASDSRLAGLRPAARPKTVLEAGEAARAATNAAAASLAATAEAQVAEEAALAAAAPASKLAVAISRKPEARPRDLSRAVEAAVAAAVRAPEPTPEPEAEPAPEPEQKTAAIKAAPKPKPEPEPTVIASSKPRKNGGKNGDNDEEADDEPEVAAAPSGKTKGSVAKQATFKNALNLSKTALIGVYGTPSNRYAMIRTEAGRYKKVKVGDKVDGGKIQAITASEVRYQKGSKLVTLAMPKS